LACRPFGVSAQVQCPQYRARQPEPPVADGGDQARFGAPDGDDDTTDRRIIGATVFAPPPILDAGQTRPPDPAPQPALARSQDTGPGLARQICVCGSEGGRKDRLGRDAIRWCGGKMQYRAHPPQLRRQRSKAYGYGLPRCGRFTALRVMTAIPARKLHDKNCRFWSGRSAARRSARRGAAVSGCAGAGNQAAGGCGGKDVFR
jgi:hypothetical protein